MMSRTPMAGLLLLLAMTVQAAPAPTRIEFPLVGQELKDGEIVEVDLGSLNEALAAPEMREKFVGFPNSVAFGAQDSRTAKRLADRASRAARALKRDLHLYAYGKAGLSVHEIPQPACYRGRPGEVAGVVKGLIGSVFHKAQNVQAYRYGKTKVILPHAKKKFFENAPTERDRHLLDSPDAVAAWENYDEESNSVLVITAYGTALYPTVFPRCN